MTNNLSIGWLICMRRWLTHSIDIHIGIDFKWLNLCKCATQTQSRTIEWLGVILGTAFSPGSGSAPHSSPTNDTYSSRTLAIRPRYERPLTSTATCWACSVSVAHNICINDTSKCWTIHAWMELVCGVSFELDDLCLGAWDLASSLHGSGSTCSALHKGNLWRWETPGWFNLKAPNA